MNNFIGLYNSHAKIGSLYRVLVDVDLTLVDSLSPWVDWFNADNIEKSKICEGKGPAPFQPITKECYMAHAGDLAILMRERAHPAWLQRDVFVAGQWMKSPTGRDPMDWWRNPDLYAKMNPLPGAHEFLVGLKKALLEKFEVVEFVAVTKCEPEHERSKRQFVYHHFPGLFSGFVSTDEKHMLAGDCLIDDNPKYVQPCITNNIYPIFVPQGNYEKLDLSNVEDMLYIKHVDGQTHFDFLNLNMRDVVQNLVDHYQRVRQYVCSGAESVQ